VYEQFLSAVNLQLFPFASFSLLKIGAPKEKSPFERVLPSFTNQLNTSDSPFRVFVAPFFIR